MISITVFYLRSIFATSLNLMKLQTIFQFLSTATDVLSVLNNMGDIICKLNYFTSPDQLSLPTIGLSEAIHIQLVVTCRRRSHLSDDAKRKEALRHAFELLDQPLMTLLVVKLLNLNLLTENKFLTSSKKNIHLQQVKKVLVQVADRWCSYVTTTYPCRVSKNSPNNGLMFHVTM